LHVAHDVSSNFPAIERRFVALGNGKANPILRIYSPVETLTCRTSNTPTVFLDGESWRERRQPGGVPSGIRGILKGCRQIGPKLNGGNRKFSNARLRAAFLTGR
jgi:hypothetical protein